MNIKSITIIDLCFDELTYIGNINIYLYGFYSNSNS